MADYLARREAFKEQLSKATYKEALVEKYIYLLSSASKFLINYSNFIISKKTAEETALLMRDVNAYWKIFNESLVDFWLVIRNHIQALSREENISFTKVVFNLYINLQNPEIISIIDGTLREIEKMVKQLIGLNDTFNWSMREE